MLVKIFDRKLVLPIARLFVTALLSSGLCLSAHANSLPPLKLMSPLSSVSLDSLAGEADSAYANKQFKAAEDSFRAILELDASNRRAMFRLGNIYQQLGKNEQAIDFYRQASQATEFSQQLDEFGEKALINIALLASEQMKSALAELEKRKASVKISPISQSLVDELSDSQALIAARVAMLHKNSQPKKYQITEAEVPPEVINGNHNNGKQKPALKAPPRVTYSQQADPSANSPEITYVKGIPVKEPAIRAARELKDAGTSDKKVVKRRVLARTKSL
jgi:tetratricopeptide (TPR) repeat protein